MILVLSFAALVFMLLAWISANSLSRPIEAITEIAHRIQDGAETVKFDKRYRTVELRNLSQALESMSSTLLQRKNELERSNLELEKKVAERTADLIRSNEMLERLADTDELTGLANRRQVRDRLALEFKRFKRLEDPYCVLALDIDFFKKINDTFGHAAGDDVLKQVAKRLSMMLRETDFVARMGGEEFLVLLPMTELDDAIKVADKIRSVIDAVDFDDVGKVTISIGASQVQEADLDIQQTLDRADRHLYAAKAAGRNRVWSDRDCA